MTEIAQPRRSFPTIWRVAGGVLLLVAVVVFIGVLVENDARGELPDAEASIGSVLREFGYLAGFGLIYIEESGIPLFIPGDAFLVYVGHALPYSFPILLAAWLGFILAVILGATNLYLISRRYGRRLLEHRLARFLHLTPARLEEAEHWFRRYGPWALIGGRHPRAAVSRFRDQRAGLERDMGGTVPDTGRGFRQQRRPFDPREHMDLCRGGGRRRRHRRGGRVHSIAPPRARKLDSR